MLNFILLVQELCERLHFDPTMAQDKHTKIYRERYEKALSDRKIDDEDAKLLLRVRVLLCIQVS